MKHPMKFVTVSVAVIAIAVAYGQQPGDVDDRTDRLQRALEQLKRAPRAMEQVSPAQDRLLEQLVEEVTFLHRENSVLRKEVDALKSKG